VEWATWAVTDSSLLKAALYQILLRIANAGNNREKAKAVKRLEVSFLNSFGTSKSF